MSEDVIHKAVMHDLEHIPRGDEGSTQNLFRSAYQMARGYDLKRYAGSPQKDSFRKVLNVVRQQHPDFFPVCDKSYFQQS